MKTFLKFVLIGLVFNVAGEVVNQIYLQHSVAHFFDTVEKYVILMIVVFFVRKGYNFIVRNKLANIIIWYLIFGIGGLAIEWLLLGTGGNIWFVQIGMFTFWATFGVMPALFTEEPAFRGLRKGAAWFAVIWIPVYLIWGAFNSSAGLFVWIFGTIWLNYYYFKYFVLLGKYRPGTMVG